MKGRAGRRGPATAGGFVTIRPIGPTDLGASRHRGVPMKLKPQVRRSPGVPRAVFIGLLCLTPGGLTFQAPRPLALRLSGSVPLHRWWRAAGAPGPGSLGRPGRVCVFAPGSRATASRPAPATLADAPFVGREV
jgi:hypothetical protein